MSQQPRRPESLSPSQSAWPSSAGQETNKPAAKPTGEVRADLTELEPRVLFSGVPADVFLDQVEALASLDVDQADSWIDTLGDDGSSFDYVGLAERGLDAITPLLGDASFAESFAVDSQTSAEPVGIVFIDSGVANSDALIASIAGASDGAQFGVVMLDATRNGIDQITQALSSYSGVQQVHIVSHGTAGQVVLGNTLLNLGSAQAQAEQLASWSQYLGNDADILFYGCDLAATDEGQSLVDFIAGQTEADVAASDDVTGHEDLGGDWDLEYAAGVVDYGSFLDGTAWYGQLDLAAVSGEILVNTSIPENQFSTPYGGGNVAMDDAGNYVVVWEDYRSGNADSYAKVFNADGSVRVNEFRVHAANSSAQDWTNVAMADNGNFVVTWSDNRSGGYETYMRLFDIDGTALTAETMVSALTGVQDAHAVDFAADGSFVITFQNASDTDIYFQRYNSSGVAQGANTKANTFTTNTQNHPDVAVNDDGSFIVTWMSNNQDGDNYGFYGQRFTAAGAKSGSEFQINQATAGAQWFGTIDSDASGNFVTTWMSDDGNGYGIYARLYDASGSALGNEFQVNTWTSGNQGSPNVAVDDDGDFVITWQDTSGHDGTGFGVYAQQYDSSGNAVGVETRISQTTSNDQKDPTVAIHGTSAVIVWSGNGSQTGQVDSSGVFMRQFSLTGLGAQTLVVTNTLDDGSYGSLRWAINYSNTNSGYTDTINFAIGSGTQTISLSSALPTLTDSVIIDAWTQPGFSGTPRIIIDANGVTGDGFQLNSNADNSTIRGFVIRDFVGDGIQINSGSTGNAIEGNYIGSLNAAGTNQGVGEQNTGHGINILGSANLIGGTTAQSRNVIGGNQGSGIFIASGIATTNTVLGNYIGVDATGATALANDYGIFVTSTDGTIIGNGTAAGRNVISGNTKQGIYNWNSDSTTIQGNYIGTDATGTADLNGSAQEGSKSGIVVDGGSTNVLIGGLTAGQGNLISGNNWYGVEFWSGVTNSYVFGNYIGTDVTGLVDLGNTVGGVGMWGSSTGNVVGGGTSAHRNVISGNDWVGVNIGNSSSATTVQGNYIGLGADGSTVVGNTMGVVVYNNSAGSLIGTNADGSNDAGERNVISGNQTGVLIADTGTTGTMVYGNYIGTDATGLLDRGNTVDGVRIESGATNNYIGGAGNRRNVIAGNDGDGIQIDGEATDGTFIQNNYIGLAANGTTVLGNAGNGIHITGGADNTTIGGGSGLGNVIVGSGYNGIEINGASSGTTITGNYIGINAAGTVVAGNMMHGIQLINGVSNTTIGSTVAGQGNVITANGVGGTYTNGVDVFSSGTGNSIVGNSIYDNVGIGIDLDSDGVTANDNLDPDTGSNNLQNFPVITSTIVDAAGTTVTVNGSINTLANLTGVMLHFYATPSNGDVTKRDGRKYIGNTIVNTDASGNAVFNIGLTGYSGTVAAGDLITATATYSNNTSEFSQGAVATLSTGNSAPSDLDTVSTTGGGLQINSDGGNDTILVADDGGTIFGGLTQMTIETQLAFTNGTADMTLMSYGVGGTNVGNDVNVRLYGDGTLRFYINGSFVSANSFNYSSLADGQQHSLAITWSNTAGAWQVYVDGTLRDSGTGLRTGATVQSGGTLAFGNDQDRQGNSYDPNQKFSGTLYDVRVFNDVRSAGEIAASYRSDLPYTESGLLANWKFADLSTAGVVTDTVSGNNLTVNHLTGTGFTASNPSLTLRVTENALDGTVVGAIAGIDVDREAKIASLLAADPTLRYSAETGKFYKVVSSATTWATAQTNALAATLNGVGGQLATIRSAAEFEVVRSVGQTAGISGGWLGASDSAVEGEWRWYDGTTADDRFALANGDSFSGAYTSFGALEPSGGATENHLEFDVNAGQWNDLSGSASRAYFVEWNADEVLDATNALTYSIQSQTVAGAFTINSDTGEITVADGSLLDYETNATHTVTVRVSDGAATYDEAFTISLNNITEPANGAPTDLSSGIELNTDGGNDAYLIANDGGVILGGLSQVTFETTFKVDPATRPTFLSYASSGGPNELTMWVTSGGSLSFVLNNGTNNVTSITIAELSDGQQHSLAWSWDNTNGDWFIYLDGNLADSGTGLHVGATLEAGGTLIIGQEQDALGGGFENAEAFKGALYDVRIWNEVRSEAEISLNYQHKFDSGSLPSGLMANWQMDGFNGSNEIVDVVSGNNLSVGHATGTGFVASTPVDDLHISEHASDGDTVGYVVPSDPDSPEDIVSDGLFQNAPDPGISHIYSTGQSFGDWTVRSGDVDLLGTFSEKSPLGGWTVDLNGTQPGGIYQSLTTETGRQYQVVFAVSGHFGFGDAVKDVRVSASGQNADFSMTEPNDWSLSNMQWEHRSFTFTADSASTDLDFTSLDIGAGNTGPVIADVQVIEIPAAVSTILNNDPTLSYDAATGKFYRVVTGSYSFDAALQGAMASEVNGVSGQLMQIHSEYENKLAVELAAESTEFVWLGGSDATTEGDWRWLEGNQDGDAFWSGAAGGSPVNGSYTNWYSGGDPHGALAGEDYLFMKTSGTQIPAAQIGDWFDYTSVDSGGYGISYIVEWDASEVLSNFTFSLTDDAGGRFAIDSNTGEITVADGSLLDYESATSHDVTVEVTDAAGNTYSEVMSISIDNGLDPVILGLPQDYVTELNQSSPLIHLRLGESSGSTAFDSAGNHDGTYLGGVVLGATGAIDGDADTAVTFANAQHIEVAHSPDFLVDEGTFQLWFKTADITQEGTLFSKDAMTYGAGGHITAEITTSGEIQVRLQSASGQYYISTNSATQPISENEWHHFAFSFGSGGMKLYIDGQLMDADAYTGGMGTSSGGSGNAETLVIGAANDHSTSGTTNDLQRFYEGQIDEFALLGSQLSDAQVLDLFQSQSPGYVIPEDTTLVFSTANGNAVSVSDSLATTNTPMQVFLSVNDGTLTLSQTTGLSIPGGANGSSFMTIQGTESDINAALEGMTFTPNANFNGSVTLNMTTSLAADLEGHYTFEGGNAVDQSVGISQNGTLVGNATTVTDPERGEVLSLDGTGDYVEINGLFGEPASVTLSAYVNLIHDGSNIGDVISLGDNVALRVDRFTDGTGVVGLFYNGSSWERIDSGVFIADTGWRHVAYTYDANSNTQSLYIDGVLVASGSSANPISYSLGANTILGANGNGAATTDFNGLIDDARIYTRALTANEIAALAADQTEATGSVAITVNAVNDAPTFTTAIEIDNHSFEWDVLASDGQAINTAIKGWTKTGTNTGVWNTTPAAYPAEAPDGVNVAYIDEGGTISQTTSAVFSAGTDYSLTVAVGDELDPSDPNAWAIRLYAGTQLLGSVTHADFDPANGTFPDATLTLTADQLNAFSASYGENIRVELYDSGASANVQFDNVRLTQTSSAITTGSIDFVEGGSAVVLDRDVQIFDAELSAANNFAGSTLTLARNGGASSEDVFSATGTLSSISAASGNVVVGGTTIGTYTNSGGTLVFTFNANATNTLVNSAVQQIAYSNSSDTPPASVQIDWTLDDGNAADSQGTGGALQATGSTAVTIHAAADLAITAPATASTNEDTALVYSGANVVSIDDGIAADTRVQVSLSVANGTLTLASLTGIDVVVGSDGTATMVIEGLESAINTALDGLTFTPNTDFNGADTLNISTSLSADLQGHYTFEGGNANDQSIGTMQNGVFVGNATTVIDAERGEVLSLDGDGDYVEINSLFGSPSSVTLATWFNLTSYDASGSNVISLGENVLIWLSSWDDTVRGSFYDGTAWHQTSVSGLTASLPGSGWNHIAYTIDDATNTQTLYLNGVAIATTNHTETVQYTSFTTTRIGAHAGTSIYRDFNGLMDDVRIYDRSLSADEIAALATDQTEANDSVAITVNSVNDAPTFDAGDGIVNTSFGASNDIGRSVIVQGDGKMLVAGYTDVSGNQDFALIRYNADGSLDTTFGGGDGSVTTAIGTGNDQGLSVTLQADGKILVAGHSFNGSNNDFALVRYNADGTLDTTFGGGDGKVTTAVGTGHDYANSVTIQADGRILVAGLSFNGSDNDFALVRYNSDGTLDTSFSGDGILTTAIGASNDVGYSVTVQTDGKILLAGGSNNGSNNDFALVRYNSNGTLDTSFGGGDGNVTTAFGGSDDVGRSVTLQEDGKILVSGYSYNGANYDFAVARYNSDGTLDTSFGGGTGKVTTTVGTSHDYAYSLAVQDDGKILVAGNAFGVADDDFALVRYNADGTLDNSFGGGDGRVTTAVGSGADYALGLTIQDDGKILVTGYSYNGTNYDFSLVRYNSDGTLDARFDLANTLGGSPTYVEGGAAVVLDSDVQIFDAELSTANNFSGSTLTLVRNGGGNADDALAFDGTNVTTSGANVIVGGVTVGTYTFTGGELTISFSSNATQARVNTVAQNIVYWNTSDAPLASVQIDWTFNDGNTASAQGSGGALEATGSTTVNITATNDDPVLSLGLGGGTYYENATGVFIDSVATVTDADGLDFDGGVLTTWVSNNGTADDRLFVQHEGAGAGQVNVSSSNILIDGVTIGSFTGGNGDADPLLVTFNANADVTDVEKVVRRISFRVDSEDPSGLQRTISMQLTDGDGGTSVIDTRTENVIPINDAPDGADNTITINEDATYTFTAADFGFSDIDSDNFNRVWVMTLPGAGQLKYNGSTFAANNWILKSDIDLGLLTFEPVPDANGSGYASFDFQVQDNGGTSNGGVNRDPTSNTITFDVTAQNDAPTASHGGTYTINEGDALNLDASGSADIDGDTLTYRWDLNNDATYDIVTTSATLSPAWSALTSYGIDDEGVYTIGLQVDDGNGGVVTTSTTVTVNNVAPTLTATGATTVGGGATYTLTLTDVDPGNDTISSWIVNWGDGSIDTYIGDPSSVTHVYANDLAGLTMDITVSAIDEDGQYFAATMVAPAYVGDYATLYRGYDAQFLDVIALASDGIGGHANVVITASGNYLIAGLDTGNILEYQPDGTLVGEFIAAGTGGLNNPGGMAFGPDGNLYVADYGDGEILRFDGVTGAFIDAFVPNGTPGLNSPLGLEFGPDGNLYVASRGSAGVLKFDGITGARDTGFVVAAISGAEDLTFGPDGNIYVGSVNGVIRVDASTGATSTFIANGVGGLGLAAGLDFGPDGSLYVADQDNDVIRRYDGSTGAYIDDYASGIDGPAYMDFTPDHRVTVTNSNQSPTIATNTGATVDEGSTANTITTAMLNEGDPDDDGAELTYTVTSLVSNGTLRLNGTALGVSDTFTQADIDAGLVTYDHDGSETVADSFDFSLADGGENGSTPATGTFNIAVNPVNDAPVLDTSGAPTMTGISEDDIGNAGMTVADLLLTGAGGDPISDPDGDPEGIAITTRNNGNGMWQYSIDGGSNWSNVGTVSEASALLLRSTDLIRFNPDGDNGITQTFEFRAWDQTSGTAGTKVDTTANGGTTAFSTAIESASITVSDVNDDPYNSGSLPTDVTVIEDVLSSVDLSSVDFSDVDAGGATLTVTLSTATGGQLTLAADGSLTFGGTATARTITGTLANLNAYFNNASSIQYLHGTPHAFGDNADTITVVINDNGNTGTGGGADQTVGTVNVDITAVNDEEVLVTNAGATVAEGSTGTVITTALLETADVDNATSQLVYTVDAIPVNGTLRLNGTTLSIGQTFTQDDIDNNRVTYDHDGSQTGSDSFDFTVDDGAGTTTSATFNFTVTNVNDAPVNTVPGAQTVDEDATLAISGISVADADDNLSAVQLTVNNGALNVTLSGAASISAGANGSGDLTLSGSLADINATLASLIYQGNLNFNGSDTLTILSTDADSATDSDTVAITVGAVNDTPDVVGPGSAYAVNEQTNLDIHGTGFSVTDVDAASGTMTATFMVGEGTITLAAGNSGVSIVSNNASTVTFTGTLAQIDALLTGSSTGTILYNNGSDTPSASTTITLTINDGGNTGSDPGLTADGLSEEDSTSQTINITATNDIPFVNMSTGGETYVENASPVIVDSGVTVTDADNLDFDGGVLTVSLDLNGTTNDRLTVLHEGTGAGQINVVGNTISIDGTQIATFTGGVGAGDDLLVTFDSDAFATDVEKVARRVAFSNTSDDPSDAIRVVGMQVSDGDGLTSLSDQRVVYVTAINDEEVLAANTGSIVAEGSTSNVITTAMLETTDVDNSTAQLVYMVDVVPANGTLRLNGTALSNGQTFTQADIDAGNVTYDHDGSQTTTDSFDFTVDDGQGSDTSGTFTFNVTNVNDPPVVTVPPTQNVNEDTSILIGGISVADEDGDLQSVQLTAGNGTLAVTLQGGATISAGANGSSTLTISGSQADINATVAAIAYQGDTDYHGTDSISVVATDSSSATHATSFDVVVAPVNDAPVLPNGTTMTMTEGPTGVAPLWTLSVTDVDGVDFDGGILTAQLTTGADGNEQMWFASGAHLSTVGSALFYDGTDIGTVTGLWTPGPIVVNFNANATLTEVQEVFRNISVGLPGDNPSPGDRTLEVTLTDGDGGTSNTSFTTLHTALINDDPTNSGSLPTDVVVVEDIATTLDLSAIDLVDPDANSGLLALKLTAGSGNLTAAAAAGITIVGNNSANMTLTGTLADLNTYLNVATNLSYLHSVADTFGNDADTIQVAINDNGNTGNGGGADVALGTVNVDITAVNDEQVLATNTGATVAEGSSGNAITTAMLHTTDIDNTDTELVYTLGSVPMNGTLRLNGTALAAGNTFTQADIDAGLVTYDHDGSQTSSDSFDFTVDDGSGVTSAGTFIYVVTNVNDAPVAGNIEGAALSYTENGGAVAITSSITFTDVDDTNIESAVVQITAGYASGEDVLSFTNQLGISGVYDAVSGSWTLTGSATLADYETAIRSITYHNTSNNPSTATRTVSFTVNDGDANSNTVTRDIAIIAVNDDPTNAGGLPADVVVTEDVLSDVDLSAIDLSDLDHNGSSLTLTLSTASGGQLFASSGGGVVIGGTPTALTLTGSLANLNAFLDDASQIQYRHGTPDTFGGSADTILVAVNDNGNTGAGGGLDQMLGTVNVEIVAVNDAPVLASNTGATVAEGGAVTLTSSMLAGADVDDIGAELIYTVTSGPANGQLELTTNAGVAIATFTQDDIDNNRVVFIHDGTQAAADAFDFSLADGGEDGAVPVTGTFNFTVTNVNDAPDDILPGVFAVNENTDTSSGYSLGAMVASDTDPGDTFTFAVVGGADAGLFSIGGFGGDELILTAGTTDYETRPAYGVRVRVTDAVGAWYEKDLTVNVNDINEAPTIGLANTVVALDESTDTSAGLKIADIVISDDALGINALTLTGADAGLFEIVGNELRLVSGAILDYEAQTMLSVNVVVDDSAVGGSPDDSVTHLITIVDHDEFDVSSPVDVNSSLNRVNENATNGTPVGLTAFAEDADGTQNAVSFALLDDAGGRFAIDPITGVVTAVGGIDYETATSHDIIVQATSADGSTASQTFTIQVQDLNENPVVTTPPSIVTNEDVVTSVSGIKLIDVDGNVAEVQLSVSEGSLNVNLSGSATVVGGANGSGFLVLNGTQADLQLALDSLSYLGASDFHGSDTLNVTVRDSGGLSTAASIAIDVLAVNDAPVGVADAIAIAEDSAVAGFDVLANDSDIEGDALTATLVSGPSHADAFVLNSDGTFQYQPARDYYGTDSFAYRVNDGNTSSAPVVVTISIAPVNDAPVGFADSYSVTFGEILNNAAGVFANDSDVEGNALTGVLISAPAHGVLLFQADGAFTYLPDPGFFGTDQFVYAPNDGAAFGQPTTVTIEVLVPGIPQGGGGGTGTGGGGGESTPDGDGDSGTGNEGDGQNDDSSSNAITGGIPAGLANLFGQSRGSNDKADWFSNASSTSSDDAADSDFNARSSGVDTIPIPDQKDALHALAKIAERGVVPTTGQASEIREVMSEGMSFVYNAEQLWQQASELERSVVGNARFEFDMTTSLTVTTASAVTGIVLWSLRGGFLVATLASSLPTWTHFDPLPILDGSSRKVGGAVHDHAESLFD